MTEPLRSNPLSAAEAIENASGCFDPDFIRMVAASSPADQDRVKRILQGKFPKEFRARSFQLEISDLRKSSIHEVSGDEQPELLQYTLSDDGNAQRLLHIHGDTMRYCPGFKAWLIWDGRRWKQDDSGRAQELAVSAMREFLKQAMGTEAPWKFANKSLDYKKILAALSLAAPRVSVNAQDLDTSPWLLNFRNGTVDLRDGKLKPHCPDDLITKLCGHSYRLNAPCKRWCGFLDWAMGGGPDTNEAELAKAGRFTDYLQRALGYSITGSTSEKALFIPWGELGNNGKTTMLVVVARILPEYSGMLDVKTLMTRRNESSNASADIADLRGVRFVRTSESESSHALDQALVKKLTEGQGAVKAIKKYENWISFTATHKIWLDTNGRPRITDPDDRATMNRLHLISFPATLAEDDIEARRKECRAQGFAEFPDMLVAKEAEGILAWLVQGAGKWYRDRLHRPAEALAARDKWRDDMEVEDVWKIDIRNWIEEQERQFQDSSRSMEEGEFFSFSVKDILTFVIKIRLDQQDDKSFHSRRVGHVISKFVGDDGKPMFERFRGARPNRDWFYKRSTCKTP